MRNKTIISSIGLFLLSSSSGLSDTSFTVLNRSGLTVAQAKFYYLGYGQVGNAFYVLNQDGTWAQASTANGWNPTGYNPNAAGHNKNTGAGIVPCYQLQSSAIINLPANITGARVYFFQVNSSSTLFNTPCQNTVSTGNFVNGVFNNTFTPGSGGAAPFSYFATTGGGGLVGPALNEVIQTGTMPPWTYSELGTNTIDTSQVDFIGFLMNVSAKPNSFPLNVSIPVASRGIGFSFDPPSAISNNVSWQSVLSSYTNFANSLSGQDKTNYNNLMKSTSAVSSILLNPGQYIGSVDPTSFAGYFDNLVKNYIWSPGWSGQIDDGGAFGSLPQVTFSGKAVQIEYPSYSGGTPLYAIKFTAQVRTILNVVAYVLSPDSYKTLCLAGSIQCGSAYSTPYQVFATAGALTTPVDNNQFQLLTSTEQGVWNRYFGGSSNYGAVVSRLGFVISMAFNHGVAGGLPNTGGLCEGYTKISQCWNNPQFWYPISGNSATYYTGDITQNLFSRWLHTAQINSVPMMSQPSIIAIGGSGAMGMGYGFASDEDPTPPNGTGAQNPQTPSKYDGNVDAKLHPTCNYITIMPWSTHSSPNLSPVTDLVNCDDAQPASP